MTKETGKRGRPRLDTQMIPLILDAAERLPARQGVLEVSVRDIADEAGIPQSSTPSASATWIVTS